MPQQFQIHKQKSFKKWKCMKMVNVDRNAAKYDQECLSAQVMQVTPGRGKNMFVSLFVLLLWPVLATSFKFRYCAFISC